MTSQSPFSISGDTFSKFHDRFTNQPYNVNTSHPLIPSSQEYMFFKKYVSIHSEDRDTLRFPNSSEFEIEMPEDILNIAAIKLIQWTFPANYDTFTPFNGNVSLSFHINNPYNPGANNVSSQYNQRIFEALWTMQTRPFSFLIEDGFYNPLQMATELTNKFNETATRVILEYFEQQLIDHPSDGWDTTIADFKTAGGYNRFIVVYNNVSLKLWFGNTADGFTILNELGVVTNLLLDSICLNNRNHLPDASNWGLAGYLGLPRCNSNSISSENISNISSISKYNGTIVPRFYYGDVTPGDNGYWLLPLDLSGCTVHWVEASYKLNIMGEAFIYMELDGQNCIDETSPYNVSRFTVETNKTNGVVNAAFAKLPVPTTPLSQWFDRDAVPYKYYYPPAERMRRIKIKLRYHNGQPVVFGAFNYSFMLEFTTMVPQMLRESRTIVYPPPVGR